MHPRFSAATLRIGSILSLALASPALANTSTYSFKMQHEVVDGQKNGVIHRMDPGLLTLSGTLTASRLLVHAPALPQSILIEVFEVGTFSNRLICSLTVTSPKSGGSASFNKTCPSVPASNLFIKAHRGGYNGWSIEVTGTLTAK
jgi:hypothetical protein